MESNWAFTDGLGPEKVIELYEPSSGLRAAVVVDNTACGPAIGGTRMANDVSVAECFRLARAMTLKNAAAGLPHGGAKSVISAAASAPLELKERLIRIFARQIEPVHDYIAGPDMGTNEQCMGWIYDEIRRAVGLPPEIGGIPLDEIGATGFGVAVCADVAQHFCGLDLGRARVVVQGFGSVGQHAARFLTKKGAMVIGASDSRGAVTNPDGLDVAKLIEHKRAGGALNEWSGGEALARDDVIEIECDLWIPAARPDVIRTDNVDRLKTRLVVQGANIAITDDAEAALAERGVLVVPDFIANAGGVICAAVEYRGGTEVDALRSIEEKIRTNTTNVLEQALRSGTTPRAAAMSLAEIRVRNAMRLRRWH